MCHWQDRAAANPADLRKRELTARPPNQILSGCCGVAPSPRMRLRVLSRHHPASHEQNRRVERFSTRPRQEAASQGRRSDPGQGAQAASGGHCQGSAGALPAGARESSRSFRRVASARPLEIGGRRVRGGRGHPATGAAGRSEIRRTAQQSGRGPVRHGPIREGAGELRKIDCAPPEFSGRDQQSRQCLSEA